VKTRPILFSAPMVLAILDGRKTQTRRVAWFEPSPTDGIVHSRPCPYGAPRDRLYVRETWNLCAAKELAPGDALGPRSPTNRALRVVYRAGGSETHPEHPEYGHSRWRSSLYMPQWASRLTLEITQVRLERLQDISEDDARAEGVDEWIPCTLHTGLRGVHIGGARRKGTCREHYELLWEQINGKRAPWASNPWVFVISFRRLKSAAPAATSQATVA
jgi:hypothetical protein